jgi:hypothetical protein
MQSGLLDRERFAPDLGISIDPNHTQIFIDDAGLLASGSRNIVAGSGPGDFVELHRVFNSGSRTT